MFSQSSLFTLTLWHRNEALRSAAILVAVRLAAGCCSTAALISTTVATAMMRCSLPHRGHAETVAFLLDRGADAWSELAMRYAREERHDAVVALLLARRGGGAAQ